MNLSVLCDPSGRALIKSDAPVIYGKRISAKLKKRTVLCDPAGRAPKERCSRYLPGHESQRNQKKRTVLCDPAGIRTQGPYIKSVMLYQLSYGIIASNSLNAGAKICSYTSSTNCFFTFF